jgi:hypothetical protein
VRVLCLFPRTAGLALFFLFFTFFWYIPILLGARTLFVSTDSPDLLDELEDEDASALYSSWLRVVYEKDEIRGTDITNANLQNRHTKKLKIKN